MNGNKAMKRVFPIFFKGLMVVLGVVVGRLRSAYTLLTNPTVTMDARGKFASSSSVGGLTRLVPHSKGQQDTNPIMIVDHVRQTLSQYFNPDRVSSIGLLSVPPLTADASEQVMELLKLHTIVGHELRRDHQVRVLEVSLGSVRNSLDLRTSPGGEAKKKLIELFKSSSVQHDSTSTNSAFQTMAESWGVARLIAQRETVAQFKRDFPDQVSRLREDVMKRKVFRDHDKATSAILSELVESEVDKMLMKRFGIH